MATALRSASQISLSAAAWQRSTCRAPRARSQALCTSEASAATHGRGRAPVNSRAQPGLPFAFCLLPFAFCLLPFAFCLLPFAFCLAPCSLLFALHSLPRHPQLAFAPRPCTCTCNLHLQPAPATCNLQPATCNLQAIQYFSLRGNRLRRPLLNSPLDQANRQR
ncbi:hypothetical protein ISG18_08190 [Burkholderia pseudomallei]|nr:hypothetical protein [Burkholderia pseudomallei]